MPTYSYKCKECGEVFDKFQSMSSPWPPCPKCLEPKTDKQITAPMGINGGFTDTGLRVSRKT
jgi:putative FmdB family regulatory protein